MVIRSDVLKTEILDISCNITNWLIPVIYQAHQSGKNKFPWMPLAKWVCLVTDRTNKRYRNRVDIAMQKDEYHKARQFGRQKLTVKVIDVTNVSYQNANNR